MCQWYVFLFQLMWCIQGLRRSNCYLHAHIQLAGTCSIAGLATQTNSLPYLGLVNLIAVILPASNITIPGSETALRHRNLDLPLHVFWYQSYAHHSSSMPGLVKGPLPAVKVFKPCRIPYVNYKCDALIA